MKTEPPEQIPGLPVRGVILIDCMFGEDEEETALLQDLAKQARDYITSFTWCSSLQNIYFGEGVGGVIGIFLANIIPSSPNVDKWLWIIVGDVPPAYLVAEDCNTPAEALQIYIELISEWVELAKTGQTSDDVIPVNVPATPEWAEILGTRLETLRTEILPQFSLPRNLRNSF